MLLEDDCDDFRRPTAGLRFVAAILAANAAFFRPGRCEMSRWGDRSTRLAVPGGTFINGCCPSGSKCSFSDAGRTAPGPGAGALHSTLTLEGLTPDCNDDTSDCSLVSSSLSFRVVGDTILAVFGK